MTAMWSGFIPGTSAGGRSRRCALSRFTALRHEETASPVATVRTHAFGLPASLESVAHRCHARAHAS